MISSSNGITQEIERSCERDHMIKIAKMIKRYRKLAGERSLTRSERAEMVGAAWALSDVVLRYFED